MLDQVKSGEVCEEISEQNIDTEVTDFVQILGVFFAFKEALFHVSGKKNLQAKVLSSDIQVRNFVNNISDTYSIA